MDDVETLADPFGLQLAKHYRAEILDRPRVLGPPPRESDHMNSTGAVEVKKNLKNLVTHWQACDVLPEHCREGRGSFQVAQTAEEAEFMAAELLTEATRYYQAVAFEIFFNGHSRDKDHKSLVLVAGVFSGKAVAFRLELLRDREWPRSLRHLFDSQFCLISDDVIHKYRFLTGTGAMPRRWLDISEIISRLPRHPRWRWTSFANPDLYDLCETLFGVYPRSLEIEEAKNRIITASLGQWPLFKTPKVLDRWGAGPFEAWRSAHFRNGVGKYLSLVSVFSLLEFEIGKFREDVTYNEPIEEVIGRLQRSARLDPRPVSESVPAGTSSSFISPAVPSPATPGSIAPVQTGGQSTRDRCQGRSTNGFQSDVSKSPSTSSTPSASSTATSGAYLLQQAVLDRLDRLQAQVSRLDRHREFEREVNQALERTLELAKSIKTDSESSTTTTSDSERSERSVGPLSKADSAKKTVNASVKSRLGPVKSSARTERSLSSAARSSVFDRLEPIVPRVERKPMELLDQDQPPVELGKKYWYEPSSRPTIHVPADLKGQESKLNLTLLRTHPASLFPLRWQSEPEFFWVCKFCGRKGHKNFARCSECVEAWRTERREPDLDRWKLSHCRYPLCTRPQTHRIGACPTLHRVCVDCGYRGHAAGQCTRDDLQSLFKEYGPAGSYTKLSFPRGRGAREAEPVWGREPLKHSGPESVQFIYGRSMGQWNHWSQQWLGVMGTDDVTVDSVLRREHPKSRGPGAASSLGWSEPLRGSESGTRRGRDRPEVSQPAARSTPRSQERGRGRSQARSSHKRMKSVHDTNAKRKRRWSGSRVSVTETENTVKSSTAVDVQAVTEPQNTVTLSPVMVGEQAVAEPQHTADPAVENGGETKIERFCKKYTAIRDQRDRSPARQQRRRKRGCSHDTSKTSVELEADLNKYENSNNSVLGLD